MTPKHHQENSEKNSEKQNVPAGLVDKNAELFASDGTLKGSYNGEIRKFLKLPTIIRMHFASIYDNEKLLNPECETLLQTQFNCKGYMQEIEQFCYCNYGGFDNKPDFHKADKPKKEYWNCGKRGKCAAEGIVCRPDCIENNNLSIRETDIIKCAAYGMTDQETADKLEITINTARTHERNIREKLGFNHRGEIIKFAYQNNIIF